LLPIDEVVVVRRIGPAIFAVIYPRHVSSKGGHNGNELFQTPKFPAINPASKYIPSLGAYAAYLMALEL